MSTKIAALFPGQGSQKVGMGQDFLQNTSSKHVLDRTFSVLPELEALMFNGPIEELTLTKNAQPALLAASIAAFVAWQEQTGLVPDMAAGHSLGEFSALVAAGTLSLESGLRLVRARGQYMQEAVPAGLGAMAAILKLPVESIREVIMQTEGVEIANLNTPEQTVISGEHNAVVKACEKLKTLGAKAIPLSVSAPFHSSLMKPAAQKLQTDLAKISWQKPRFPIIANVTADVIESDLADLLAQQVTAPVRWVESIQKLWQLGARHFIEFGPGNVLTGLVKKILPEASTFNVSSLKDLPTSL